MQSYQITMTFFTELEQKSLKICMAKQKAPYSHSNLEKEKGKLEESGFLISDYTTKL